MDQVVSRTAERSRRSPVSSLFARRRQGGGSGLPPRLRESPPSDLHDRVDRGGRLFVTDELLRRCVGET
jgi:hypothetical protein